MAFVLLLTLITFVALYWIPKSRLRKERQATSKPPIQLVSGCNPFEKFLLTHRERSQRVGYLS